MSCPLIVPLLANKIFRLLW